MFHKILKSKRGEGYIDVAIGLLCLMLVVALAVSFLPVFTAKQQLDIFATEIVRQAEIVGGQAAFLIRICPYGLRLFFGQVHIFKYVLRKLLLFSVTFKLGFHAYSNLTISFLSRFIIFFSSLDI